MVINFLQLLLFVRLTTAVPAIEDKEATPLEDNDDDGDSIPIGIKPHVDPLPKGYDKAVTVDLSNMGQLLGKLPDAKAFQLEQEKKRMNIKKGALESVSGGFWESNINMDEAKDTVKSGTSPATDESKAASTSMITKNLKDASVSKTTKDAKDKTTKTLGKRAPDSERLAKVRTCLRAARKNGAPFQYYTSKSSKFAEYSSPYNQRLRKNVAEVVVVVLLRSGSSGVIAAVRCAAAERMPVQPRAGGHSYAAFSSAPVKQGGGMVIDLRNLNGMGYVGSQENLFADGGIRLGNFALGALSLGRAIPHGDCPSVGLAGHSLHGGFGYTSRMWGLSTDAIVGLDVVTADGRLRYVTQDNDPDLYWAMRGAGESFGIVTRFYLKSQPVPTRVRRFLYNLDKIYGDADQMAVAFLNTQSCVQDPRVSHASFGLTIRMSTNRYQVAGYHYGSTEEYNRLDACLERYLAKRSDKIGPLTFQGALSMIGGATPLEQPPDAGNTKANFYAKSTLIPENNQLSRESMRRYFRFLLSQDRRLNNQFIITFRLMGGPGSQVAKRGDAFSAVSNRNALWIVQHDGNTETNPEPVRDLIEEAHDELIKAGNGRDWRSFPPFIDPMLTTAKAHWVYFSAATHRALEKIKYKWDKSDVFQNPYAVMPRK